MKNTLLEEVVGTLVLGWVVITAPREAEPSSADLANTKVTVGVSGLLVSGVW